MKNIYFLLILSLITTICNAQWEQVGQILYGEFANDFTGTSVTISADGNRAAIYDAFVDGDTRGRVRVFELQGDDWIQLGDGVMGLMGDGSSAGIVKLNSSGNRFIFSSPLFEVNGFQYAGSARIFEYQQGNWTQLGNTLLGEFEQDNFGGSVDISANGDTIIIGAFQSSASNSLSGYIKVYRFENGNWIQLGNQINGEASDDQFGQSVSISSDGSRIAASSPFNNFNGVQSGQVRIFEFQNNSWVQVGSSIFGEASGDNIGGTFYPGASALSLNQNGSIIAIGVIGHDEGGVNVGQAKIFEFQNNNWVQQGQSINGDADNGLFGTTININEIGNIIIVGDPIANGFNSGQVRVYRYVNNSWNQFGDTIIGADNDFLGWCTDINNTGDRIIYGAWRNNDNGDNSGKVEILQNDNILDVSEIEQNSIIIYPNPVKEILNITAQEIINSVSISNVLGQVMYNSNMDALETKVDMFGFSKGTYFVTIEADGDTITKKIIKE